MAAPANRSLAADGQAIERYRLEKGWSVETFADRVGVSDKTIRKMIKGENVSLDSLRRVADKLGVAIKDIAKDLKDASSPQERNFQVSIVLSIPYEDFDQSVQLAAFIQQLITAIKAKGDIPIVSITDGSTVITVEMSEGELYEFATALYFRAFENIPVEALILPGSSGIPPEVRNMIRKRVSPEYYFPRGVTHASAGPSAKVTYEYGKDATEILHVDYSTPAV